MIVSFDDQGAADVNEREPESKARTDRDQEQATRTYLIGVCGSAMGGMAGMLRARGQVVGGSDTQFYEPMVGKLKDWGVQTYTGWEASNIDAFAPDQVIVGNVVRRDNPEMARVLELGLPYDSFPSYLETHFLRETENIVITGTHGKTTCSALIAWLLEAAGEAPSWFIGGIPENLGRNFSEGTGRWFVLEGDEYDTAFFDKGPKFLHYRPTHGLILNVELDHVDIYESFEAVKAAFASFSALVDARGSLTVCASEPAALACSEASAAHRVLYGPGEGAQVVPEDLVYERDETVFTIRTPEGRRGPFRTQLSGYHNVLNACGAYGLWRELAARHEQHEPHEPHQNMDNNPFSDAAFANGLASFQGVKKRLDHKGELNGALLFEDFGHHPTAIRAVLGGLRQRYPERRVVTAFRAESNTSRTPLFEDQYVEAFTGTDRLLLAATLTKRDYLKTARYFDPVQIAATLRERGVEATAHAEVSDLAETLRRELGPNDLFILFSSRGMDGLFDLLR